MGLVLFFEGYPPFDSKLKGANKKIHLRLHKKIEGLGKCPKLPVVESIQEI